MDSIKKWAKKHGYAFEEKQLYGGSGLFLQPPKGDRADALFQYVRRYFPNYKAEWRGFYTWILVYDF